MPLLQSTGFCFVICSNTVNSLRQSLRLCAFSIPLRYKGTLFRVLVVFIVDTFVTQLFRNVFSESRFQKAKLNLPFFLFVFLFVFLTLFLFVSIVIFFLIISMTILMTGFCFVLFNGFNHVLGPRIKDFIHPH